MLDFKEDVKNTYSVINGETISGYEDIFFSSNENLNEIFYRLDFTDKKVLTVLGSGDQAFHFYDHNAKHVDLFDINKLTIYFFYLRIWLIEHYNKFHFPLHLGNLFLCNLLNRVTPQTEEEEIVHNYWLELIDMLLINCKSLNSIRIDYYDSNELTEINELDNLKVQIKQRNFNFYNIDISKNDISIKEKYDVIYLSNITDWLLMNNKELNTLVNNLNNLLTDSGTIICADLPRLGTAPREEEAFQKMFNKKDLPIAREESYSDSYPPGYCYKKK